MKEKILILFSAPLKIIFKYKSIVLILILYLGYFYFFHHDESNCLVKLSIGIPCPGCGMTRAIGYLLVFDFSTAFHFHPLVFLLPIVLIIFLYQETKYFNKIANSKAFWVSILLLFIIVYAIRMSLYFPNIEPMDYYHENLINRLLRN